MSKEQEINNKLEAPVPRIQLQVEAWKDKHGAKLMQLAGDKDKADRFFVICLNTISRNPTLLSCNFESLAACILQSFQLGLMPGAFQECAYVPLNNSKTNQKEANFWIQYQGLVKLLRNAGNKAVIARVVFENDYFEYQEGYKAPIYAPAVVCGKKRGNPLFCYAAVCTAHDMWQVEVMSPEQIEVIRSRSKGAKMSDSPWNSKYDDDVFAMWSKTVLKRVSKWCTKSAELVTALEVDESEAEQPRIIDLVNNFTGLKSSELPAPAQEPIKPRELSAQGMQTIEIPKKPLAVSEPQHIQASVSQSDIGLLNPKN